MCSDWVVKPERWGFIDKNAKAVATTRADRLFKNQGSAAEDKEKRTKG